MTTTTHCPGCSWLDDQAEATEVVGPRFDGGYYHLSAAVDRPSLCGVLPRGGWRIPTDGEVEGSNGLCGKCQAKFIGPGRLKSNGR